MKIVVDAEGAIVGRLGSYVAKELLKGNEVFVINSEKAIISGSKKNIIDRINKLRKIGHGGSGKGPKIPLVADKFLKRKIRGMLPWDRPRGREAFKRLRCYIGTGQLKEEEIKKAKKFEHKKPLKYLTIKQIMELLR